MEANAPTHPECQIRASNIQINSYHCLPDISTLSNVHTSVSAQHQCVKRPYVGIYCVATSKCACASSVYQTLFLLPLHLGTRLVGITPWHGGGWEKAYLVIVGSELCFMKLGSV